MAGQAGSHGRLGGGEKGGWDEYETPLDSVGFGGATANLAELGHMTGHSVP